MNYDEKLDAILAGLRNLSDRVSAMETLLLATPEPSGGGANETGGLYQYVRPAPGTPRYGLGIRTLDFDPVELRRRACHGVRWNGEIVRTGIWEDEVWEEIEALKTGAGDLRRHYERLDPDFAGFALLTGLLDCVKHDSPFGVGASRRESYAGVTVESWCDEQRQIAAGGAIPSGNDE